MTRPDRVAAIGRLRKLLAMARASSAASVVDDVASLLLESMPGLKIIHAVIDESPEDSETFACVLREVVARHPGSWLRGFGDEGAAEDILADEERPANRDRDHTL
jgi:hypothetical protein